jgi:glycosyltransferase A (GT-A) superfamily protein (DUF2064 family)
VFSRRAIIIFAHTASTEAVSKPLSIASKATEDVYGALLRHSIATMQATSQFLGCDCLLATDTLNTRTTDSDIPTFVQRGDTFGERLRNAVQDALQHGYTEIVVMGADAPDVSAATLEHAFERLASNSVVLGPAHDGGVYLIGLRLSETFFSSSVDALFAGVAWQTANVFNNLITNARTNNSLVFTLSPLCDIDSYNDLCGWLASSQTNLHHAAADKRNHVSLLSILSRRLRQILRRAFASVSVRLPSTSKPAVQAASRLRLQFQKAPPVW